MTISGRETESRWSSNYKEYHLYEKEITYFISRTDYGFYGA